MLAEKVDILVVDDDKSIRNMLSIILEKEGYQVKVADSGRAAIGLMKQSSFDLVISDIRMPDINGIELLKKVKSIDPELPVLMITAYASTAGAVEAMKLGAEDYIIKPFNLDELKIIIKKSLYKRLIEQENIELKSKLDTKEKFENIVGTHPRMKKIFDLINTISYTDSTVLISGESGTGKELIARAIHNKSKRTSKMFVSINCGALPENLLESELFGHQKGSFTDAYQDKEGLFEVANKGTLFLDEIGEMSQKMQVKVLRAIQEKLIRRIGSNREIEVDVRIIAATNKDLIESMDRGEFRSDLYYRLNVISIMIPPLRERKEDIPYLMHYFLQRYNQRFNKTVEGFEKDVLDYFKNYNWPGNVRELENFIERAVALEQSQIITVSSLPSELIYNISEEQLPQLDWEAKLTRGKLDFNRYIDTVHKKIIIRALEMNDRNIKRTSEKLKLSYRTLRYLIDKYKLKTKP